MTAVVPVWVTSLGRFTLTTTLGDECAEAFAKLREHFRSIPPHEWRRWPLQIVKSVRMRVGDFDDRGWINALNADGPISVRHQQPHGPIVVERVFMRYDTRNTHERQGRQGQEQGQQGEARNGQRQASRSSGRTRPSRTAEGCATPA